MKNLQDYINDFENININESDFDGVDENLTEIDKERIIKNLKMNIGKNKKPRKNKKLVVAAAALLITVSVTSIPTLAENIPFISYIYEKMGFDQGYADYTTYIGKSYEHDGVKVTIDNIIGTRNKIVLMGKVESENELSDEEFGQITMSSGNGGMIKRYTGINGEKMIYAEGDGLGEKKSKGKLKIQVGFSDNYVEHDTYKVDFTKAFEKIKEININEDINALGLKVTKIESDILGTTLFTTNLEKTNSESIPGYEYMIIKVGDRMYPLSSWTGDAVSRKYELPKEIYGEIEKSNNIEIIPVQSSVETEEVWAIVKPGEKKTAKNMNINYNKELEFKDGTKGEINKIEIINDLVKVYYKGETDKHSLLMGTKMLLSNQESTNKGDWKMYNPVIYKDESPNGVYIAEFKNVDSSIQLQLDINSDAVFVDKATIGEVIKCSINK